MEDATEVRWDIRPAPRWGTIEVRACDGMSTLPELAAVAALVQVLVEHFSRELDEGRELTTLQPWFVRENKWRAARYGLDARIIVDRDGTQAPVREHLRETLDRVADIAVELKCARELSRDRDDPDPGRELRAPAAGGGCRGRRPARSRAAPHPRVPRRPDAARAPGRARALTRGSAASRQLTGRTIAANQDDSARHPRCSPVDPP